MLRFSVWCNRRVFLSLAKGVVSQGRNKVCVYYWQYADSAPAGLRFCEEAQWGRHEPTLARLLSLRIKVHQSCELSALIVGCHSSNIDLVMDLVAALNLIYRYQGDARGYTSFSFFINLRRLIVLSGSTMNLRRMARIKTRVKYMSSWDCEQRNDLGLNDRSSVKSSYLNI